MDDVIGKETDLVLYIGYSIALMNTTDHSSSEPGASLPLVRLSLVLPFVHELDHRRIDTDAVLARNGLARQTVLDADVFVPAIVIYRFVESTADAATDPRFGFCVVEKLDFSAWPPFVDSMSRSSMLVDFLYRFITAARGEATSVRYSLEVNQDWAVFRQARTSTPEIQPGQTDAFTAAYTLQILRRGAGDNWDPAGVHLTVCNPDTLPRRPFGVHVSGGDRQGVVVRFPHQWLIGRLVRQGFSATSAPDSQKVATDQGFTTVVRSMLTLHLGSTELGVDTVAGLLGISRQSLQRRLRRFGTTLSR